MLDCLTAPLAELREFQEIAEWLDKKKRQSGKKGAIFACGCVDSQKAHFIKGLGEKFSCRLIITHQEARAKELLEDYQCFDKNVVYYPAKDFIFYSADIHGNLILKERMRAIRRLLEKEPVTIITTIDGCMDKLLPLETIQERVFTIDNADTVDSDRLKEKLTELGYERMAQVEAPGEFAIRGGIIDIFPLTEECPVRIELWDDEVDSIRSFDIESQRSIEQLDKVMVYPAAEILLSEERLCAGIEKIEAEKKKNEAALRKQMKTEEAHRLKTTIDEFVEQVKLMKSSVSLDSFVEYFYEDTVCLLDYLPLEDSVVFLDEPARTIEKAETLELEFRESMSHRLEKGYILPKQSDVLWSTKQILARVQKNILVLMAALEQKQRYIDVGETFYLNVQNVNPYNNSFELLVKDLTRWKKNGYRVVLLTNSRTRGARLAEDLRDFELSAYYKEELSGEVKPGEILVTYGNVHRGFEYPMIKFVIITETDIFGVEKKKRKKKPTYEGQKIQSFTDLNIGDYVVHENHGLGIYRGIEKIKVDRAEKDYIKIEYGDGGNLYVLATQSDMIQKYAGSDAKRVKLNNLGGLEWKKTKNRVRSAVKDVAKDLVELYAARQNKQGYQYGEDTVWQREFEEMFPYEETEDQLTAIEETKKDMESPRIMDRLICGDVGYGKTEVAIRAAFKAVQENKQVVLLVPTTILAQQHYNTFNQRMKDFPVRIDMMSRFRTPKQQKDTIENLKKGLVDIVIGTHRVLSKDMQFKDLGLLIVDEEQRFGVTHKEKIKQLKNTVDVLTLTATPIPRTLHMSLIGIRDMSVLEEPPVDRLPIQTYVCEHNDEMIREAINRELARGGQVYYVYNRVNNIDEIADYVAKLVPEANVAFAHGQMKEHQLEKIMYAFINGEIDVLVSTTIIETGLDISNVNTMIIHDADQLGLSQLYQLRGRVGRSNRTAYAFLMYRRNKMLKEVAEKRLAAIREFTDLGSGFKIAMRDLEIRGAGNILGAEQHGHMEAVGYDLYCKMLNEAVKSLQGIEVPKDFETTIDMDINAYIPSSYIKNEALKLDIYKRIAAIETMDEYADMQDELIDRFGTMPKSVENLLSIAYLKATAHALDITDIKANRNEMKLVMYENAAVDVARIPEFLAEFKNRLNFKPAKPPYFVYTYQKTDARDEESQIETLRGLLEEMKNIMLKGEAADESKKL
ncbi:MAG: transcription-repair coupling factor [Lachnospiraceae bacterium]|nr:transcription-repair coupling factor [Lachnospiraceae bacterium]